MSLQFSTNQKAIESLHQFYICLEDAKVQQPWYMKEYESGSTWGFLCGHPMEVHRKVEVEPAGHPIEMFLTAETDGYRYTSWGRSFLTQYYQLHSWGMGAKYNTTSTGGNSTCVDTGGTTRTLPTTGTNSWTQYVLATQAASTDTTYGILLGTGTGANSGSTTAMGTLIANGVGAGQLSYGAMGVTSTSGTTPLSFTLTRTATNNSGGSITPTEAGFACSVIDTAAQRFFLVGRDVNAGGIVIIANGSNSTFTYTLSYTIS